MDKDIVKDMRHGIIVILKSTTEFKRFKKGEILVAKTKIDRSFLQNLIEKQKKGTIKFLAEIIADSMMDAIKDIKKPKINSGSK